MWDDPLVSVDWLASHLGDPELVILDGTLPKAASKSNTNISSTVRIKGAKFFDLNNDFSKPGSGLPHMMCSAEQFEINIGRLGISNKSKVVIYDEHGIYSGPRVWWMLRSMGHFNVFVLNGGLPLWIEKGFSVENKRELDASVKQFVAKSSKECFIGSEDVLKRLNYENTVILDARSSGRFYGTSPEPREGLRSGHIPGSMSLPFTEVLDGGLMKPKKELQKIFEPFGPSGKRLIFTCGSGLTACIILLGAYIAGYHDLTVYDGSWSEWGKPSKLPVEV